MYIAHKPTHILCSPRNISTMGNGWIHPYCPSNKPKNAAPHFDTLLPTNGFKATCHEARGLRSERCLPPTPASDLHELVLANSMPLHHSRCKPSPRRRTSLHGTSSPNARGCHCRAGPAWALRNDISRGTFSSSVELAGIFLAFSVPLGVRSKFFAKKPGRVENPNHCQAYSINDFHFRPFPDIQDLDSLFPFRCFPDIPSLPIFLLKLKPGWPSPRWITQLLNPPSLLAFLVNIIKGCTSPIRIFIFIGCDLSQGQIHGYFKLS